jgi:hypothetical protein
MSGDRAGGVATRVWGCPLTTKTNRTNHGKDHELSPYHAQHHHQQPLKILQLSNKMDPNYISFQIHLAKRDYSINGLYCKYLNFCGEDCNSNNNDDGDNDADSNSKSIFTRHLQVLIQSRKWIRIVFDGCIGIESLLFIRDNIVLHRHSDSTAATDDDNDNDDITDDKEEEEEEEENKTEESIYEATSIVETTTTNIITITTEVFYMVLKFPSTTKNNNNYDPKRHYNFFINLWNFWKVQKCAIQLDFTPEWTLEFCRSSSSSSSSSPESSSSCLKELEICTGSRWYQDNSRTHLSSSSSDKSEESLHCTSNNSTDEKEEKENTNNGVVNDDDEYDDNNKNDDADDVIIIDCWKLFCRTLRTNQHYQNLISLKVKCKTDDEDLAYLIGRLPYYLENVDFGKECSCDKRSLLALSCALIMINAAMTVITPASAATTATTTMTTTTTTTPMLSQRLKAISISSSLSFPADEQQEEDGLTEFCHALQYATQLKRLELGKYIFSGTKMTTLVDSLIIAAQQQHQQGQGKIMRYCRGNCGIEYLSLLTCLNNNNTNSLRTNIDNCHENDCWDVFCNKALKQNQLKSLTILLLPQNSYVRQVFACNVMKYNTSLEYFNSNSATLYSNKIRYYLDLNRGGRRLLTTTSMTVSTSTTKSTTTLTTAPTSSTTKQNHHVRSELWPIVLARASLLSSSLDYTTGATALQSISDYTTASPITSSRTSSNSTVAGQRAVTRKKGNRSYPRYDGGPKRQYDVVYCLLRNLILLEL